MTRNAVLLDFSSKVPTLKGAGCCTKPPVVQKILDEVRKMAMQVGIRDY